jgi:hypothetical protein
MQMAWEYGEHGRTAAASRPGIGVHRTLRARFFHTKNAPVRQRTVADLADKL